MGNAPDKTIDKTFMLQTENLMQHFLREEPLFHSQDISFPLFTDAMKIVDSKGRRVKLAGGNWSGGHMCRHCVDGLECRPMRDIAMDIRFKFKMNVIRLTYSLQLIIDNNVIQSKYILANPDLKGKTSMQVFDITIKTLTDVGLMVILNNHTSTSQWCCSNDDGDGLWWSRDYPEYQFFQHVEHFAKRYRDNPLVIGMDMRNQIRKANGLEPSWGDGNPKTDWKRAAEISSQIALKFAPHWLILIGGINYQLDLTGVKDSPIRLSVPNKLVYTGHFYGFSWPIPSWNVYSYDNFKKKLFNTQTYVRSLGVPFLLGQFGNNNQDIPWRYLMRFLKETDIDWTYWALDGFKCDREKDQTYGVFTNDFSKARHPQMLNDMIATGPPQQALANYSIYQQKVANQGKTKSIPKNIQNVEEQYKLEKVQGARMLSNNFTNQEIPINKTQQQSIDKFSEKKKKYFEQMTQLKQDMKQGLRSGTQKIKTKIGSSSSIDQYQQPLQNQQYQQSQQSQQFNQFQNNQQQYQQPQQLQQQFNQTNQNYGNQYQQKISEQYGSGQNYQQTNINNQQFNSIPRNSWQANQQSQSNTNQYQYQQSQSQSQNQNQNQQYQNSNQNQNQNQFNTFPYQPQQNQQYQQHQQYQQNPQNQQNSQNQQNQQNQQHQQYQQNPQTQQNQQNSQNHQQYQQYQQNPQNQNQSNTSSNQSQQNQSNLNKNQNYRNSFFL